MSKDRGKSASPKKTPGELLCDKVRRVAGLLETKPEELGLIRGPRGEYVDASIEMPSILRGVKMALLAIYIREMPEKRVGELCKLVSEIL